MTKEAQAVASARSRARAATSCGRRSPSCAQAARSLRDFTSIWSPIERGEDSRAQTGGKGEKVKKEAKHVQGSVPDRRRAVGRRAAARAPLPPAPDARYRLNLPPPLQPLSAGISSATSSTPHSDAADLADLPRRARLPPPRAVGARRPLRRSSCCRRRRRPRRRRLPRARDPEDLGALSVAPPARGCRPSRRGRSRSLRTDGAADDGDAAAAAALATSSCGCCHSTRSGDPSRAVSGATASGRLRSGFRRTSSRTATQRAGEGARGGERGGARGRRSARRRKGRRRALLPTAPGAAAAATAPPAADGGGAADGRRTADGDDEKVKKEKGRRRQRNEKKGGG